MVAGAGLVLVGRREGGGAVEAPAHAPGVTGSLHTQHSFPDVRQLELRPRESPLRCCTLESNHTHPAGRHLSVGRGVKPEVPRKAFLGSRVHARAALHVPGFLVTREAAGGPFRGVRGLHSEVPSEMKASMPPDTYTLRAGGPHQESPGSLTCRSGARPCLRGQVPSATSHSESTPAGPTHDAACHEESQPGQEAALRDSVCLPVSVGKDVSFELRVSVRHVLQKLRSPSELVWSKSPSGPIRGRDLSAIARVSKHFGRKTSQVLSP